MPKNKTSKIAPYQKLLTVMLHGKPMTVEEIDSLVGKEIYTYRLSTYMWHIKTLANGVIKSIKNQRKIVAYQLMNPEEAKKHLDRIGVTRMNFIPKQTDLKPSKAKIVNKPAANPVQKLSDLKVETVEKMAVTETTE